MKLLDSRIAKPLGAGLLALAAAASSQATTVQVQVQGVVDFNVIQGDLAGVPAGALVTMTFNVDSNGYLNSTEFPTRGYMIDLASFDLNVGGVHVALDNPQTTAPGLYFVLRDNDPAVDGFFISHGVDWPTSSDVHIPGVDPMHELDFEVGYDVGSLIHSLDILAAVGTYGTQDLSSYDWGLGRFGSHGAGIMFSSLTISAVPEPAPAILLGMGMLGLALRKASRRR